MDVHGWGDICVELNRLAAAGQWDEMPAKITDEIVETFATIGTYDQIVDRVKAKFGSFATQMGFTLPVEKPGDEKRLMDKIAELQAI